MDVIRFYPEKEHSRFDYLKEFTLALIVVGICHILYPIRYPNRRFNPSLFVFDLLILAVLALHISFSKFVVQVAIDYHNRCFTVFFITFRKARNSRSIPFAALELDYKKVPSRHSINNWTVFIKEHGRKLFELSISKSGFSKETLDKIHQAVELAKINS